LQDFFTYGRRGGCNDGDEDEKPHRDASCNVVFFSALNEDEVGFGSEQKSHERMAQYLMLSPVAGRILGQF